jgi:DNA-binding MurR/RpiR family transcriptional regulator
VGWLADLEKHSGASARLAEISRNTLAIVHRTLHEQDPERLSGLVDALFQANTVYVTGFRGCYGLAHHLYYAGRMALPSMALIPQNVSSATDELVHGCSNDVVLAVTFAPYSRETIEVCKFACSRGMRLFLIADSTLIAPEIGAEEIFVASTLSTHHLECHTGAHALIEILIAMIVHKGGAKAEERVAAFEQARGEIDAYWVQNS